MVHRGQRVLPQQCLGGNFGAEVADGRTHVAVGELVPGTGEGVGECVRVRQEATRDLLVRRVGPQGEVGGQHRGGVMLGRVVGIGDGTGPGAVLGRH